MKLEEKTKKVEQVEERLSRIEKAVLMTVLASKNVLIFDEAAQFTGLSKSYLYKLTSGQKICHYKPNGKIIYFDRVELENWMKQNRVSTTDEIAGEALNYCSRKGGLR